ncbi:LOW QUALITY PROTEIN: zinc transporter ZIP9-B-like [Eurytemora carolleeae]|uniref:LOW QUALITY PROTEIN: zinc transporter ZIP9-B-like n=1 Tax=Eurytemora carolleeae TaxID=1294199 RepID=UPI000C77D097|nr:LOW QUALITY PROTEIN: zinc transporter ZIP9-B-like [Eurytemora carolleeae]|eukprot:XP_023344039.1 LOW QUALITY PROTEIN: zinc transporter ZIP9-B-like [Eurytemora affinis]
MAKPTVNMQFACISTRSRITLNLVFQLVSVLGAGLLVGTALSVIIPEGMVETLNMAYSEKHHGHGEDKEDHDNPVPHLIGVSLVLGFIFMLVVDQIAVSKSRDIESGGAGRKGNVSWTATLGLVVHAAADGVALGAAATTNQADVEMVVFLAIMLHKAPASFGLDTYLLHEGLERSRIR